MPPRASAPEAMTEIAAQMQPRHYRPRAFICRQGEPGSSLLG